MQQHGTAATRGRKAARRGRGGGVASAGFVLGARRGPRRGGAFWEKGWDGGRSRLNPKESGEGGLTWRGRWVKQRRQSEGGAEGGRAEGRARQQLSQRAGVAAAVADSAQLITRRGFVRLARSCSQLSGICSLAATHPLLHIVKFVIKGLRHRPARRQLRKRWTKRERVGVGVWGCGGGEGGVSG